MKTSITRIGLLSLALFAFANSANADGVTKVHLSASPIIGQTSASYQQVRSAPKVVLSRVQRGRMTRTTKRAVRVVARANTRKKAVTIVKIKHVGKYHHVKRGDTLYKIALKYHLTVKHIMRVNKLKSTTILIGQRLKL